MSFKCCECDRERKEILVKKIFKEKVILPTSPFTKIVVSIIIPKAKLHRCSKCKDDLYDISTIRDIRKEYLRLSKLVVQDWLNKQPVNDFMAKGEVIYHLKDFYKEDDLYKFLKKSIITTYSILKGKERYYYRPIFLMTYENIKKTYIKPISFKSDYQKEVDSVNKTKGKKPNGKDN